MAIATDRLWRAPASGRAGLGRWLTPWRAALDGAATERLFLEPEWVLPWFELLDDPSNARALFVGRGDAPLGGAVLAAGRLWPAGPRLLRPPGLGVSDYLDLLLPADAREAEAVLEALLDWLLAAGGWELLDLPNLPDEWPTAALVVRLAEARGLRHLRRPTHRRPYLTLSGDWPSFLASRPQKLRYNLRARARQLAALGTVRYGHHTTPEAVAAQLPRAVALHARRWRGQRTGTTFSSSPAAGRFYAGAIRRLAAGGRVDLATLELDDRLLAFALCFLDGRKLYYYLPAFEPDFGRYAPSTALLAHLIEQAYRSGLAEVDFMLGEEPYKDQWADGSRGTERLVLAYPSAAGTAALAACRAYLATRERARRSDRLQRLRRYGLAGLRART